MTRTATNLTSSGPSSFMIDADKPGWTEELTDAIRQARARHKTFTPKEPHTMSDLTADLIPLTGAALRKRVALEPLESLRACLEDEDCVDPEIRAVVGERITVLEAEGDVMVEWLGRVMEAVEAQRAEVDVSEPSRVREVQDATKGVEKEMDIPRVHLALATLGHDIRTPSEYAAEMVEHYREFDALRADPEAGRPGTRIQWRYRTGRWSSKGATVYGSAQKIGGAERARYGLSETWRITISLGAWLYLEDKERARLVHHELMHVATEGGHEVEEFGRTWERFGPASAQVPALTLLAEVWVRPDGQAAMFAEQGAEMVKVTASSSMK